MTDIELRTLAPEYKADDHATYVMRLNAAVREPRNKNIALTGRYGAGKSSILDRFLQHQQAPPNGKSADRPKKTLRISINTLGPDDGEDLTNRIQKELVKQLVYRAKPGSLRTSRFARVPDLTRWRACIDAFVVSTTLIGMLWLFGVRPDRNSLGTESFWAPMGALFTLTFVISWGIRWHLDQRTVSQFSTGGTSITFEEKTDSYFDKYLDELVAFFEATDPEIVVFEDLDRFDDPQIFDSLRELNTLLNTSSHWKERPDKPVRFVYAIKDSLFEKLGDGQEEKDSARREPCDDDCASADIVTDRRNPTHPGDTNTQSHTTPARKDAAEAAVERANRTKFFEIVIPVVPFLSHSNARDHLLDVIEKLKLPEGTKISRGLIDVVARHTTDMRLMINICNEFVVYAERLLWVNRPAPGLDADHLFALVVYKNFHLADFEALPHRGSVLDTLELARRDLVQSSVTSLQEERASLVDGETQRQTHRHLATQLHHRLSLFLEFGRMSLTAARIGDNSLDVTATSEPSFWQPIALTGTVTMNFHHAYSGHADSVVLDPRKLRALFPEVGDSEDWLDSPSSSDENRVAQIDREIADLRGASFDYLAGDERYAHNGKTFDTIVDELLLSQLARDLVTRGYLDRYYAEYATVFYGAFLGVDVANFFRNAVWPNEMNILFPFETEGAVANVLAQAPVDFLHTRSVLNIEIVDHLMEAGEDTTIEFIEFLTRPNNKDANRFLKTYLNTPHARSEKLVSLLAARPWPHLFTFIASDNMIDADETKVRLLTAALLSAHEAEVYELGDEARALISRLHTEIPAFTVSQTRASVEALFSILTIAEPRIPNLRVLSPELQAQVVAAQRYELSSNNLRTAASLTDTAPISAENLGARPEVWRYCAQSIDAYLDLVASDEYTPACTESPEALAQVLNSHYQEWTSPQLGAFVSASSAGSALPDITLVARETWQTVIEALRVVPNAPNLNAYANELGVDTALTHLLIDSDEVAVRIIGLEDATSEQLEPLISRLLNAEAVLTPAQRASFADQLMAAPVRPRINLTEIDATPDAMFAELLRRGLVEDTWATFEHFTTGSWASIGPALEVSQEAPKFITPALVAGHAADLVRDGRVPAATRRAVLDQLSEIAPTEDANFLTAAAEAARSLSVKLPERDLRAIAPVVRTAEDVLWQLSQHGNSITTEAVMEILGSMPGDFVGLTLTSGHEFEVADTPSLGAVLDRLRTDGVIEFPRGKPKGRRKIRIA